MGYKESVERIETKLDLLFYLNVVGYKVNEANWFDKKLKLVLSERSGI
ncbi:hypothetical protein BSM4216_3204 [Bacillus smithii]|nr:hypothetical protein BSM4216_3204 [Bacillus smithii]